MDPDPYKILNVSKNFTADELKNAYKTMAIKVHPDKGGSAYLFKLVTASYKVLSRDLEKRQSDKQYHELKAAFNKYYKQQAPDSTKDIKQTQRQHATTGSSDRIDPGRGFDLNKFNKFFEQNKVETVADTGYADFLNATPPEQDPKNLFKKKKFTNDAFNKYFEKETLKGQIESKFLTKYRDPEPLSASKKIGYTEIGSDSIDDFSAENLSKKSLNYMDLKIAHTTPRIVDPRTVNARREYRNVEDLEADRSRVSYTLNDADREYIEKQSALDLIKEKKRLERVEKEDQESQERFERLHMMLLGR